MSDAAADQAGVKRLIKLAEDPDFRARYTLGELLGIGGSGVVFSALQSGVERTVAVKFLMRLEPDDLKRFLREARVLGSLRHPHVVSVFELGELAGHPFLVTEFLGGGSLKEKLKKPTDLAEAVAIGLEVLSGLAACHELGVVHRDVKPANILFGIEGRAKLADLGLAREEKGAGLTQTGSLVGTPRYMAPEQVRGEPATPLSDVYAIGLVLYELFGGGYPFRADNLHALLLMQVNEDPKPLTAVVPGMPEGVARAVHHALAKKPEDRPGSAVALADELRSAAAAASLVSHGGMTVLKTVPADLKTAKARKTGLTPPVGDTLSTGATAAPAGRGRRTGLTAQAPAGEPSGQRAVRSSGDTGVTTTAGALPRSGNIERVKRKTPGTVQVVALAAAAGLLAGTAVMLLTRPGGGERQLVEPPAVRAGAVAARIGWRTGAPTKTAVVVWADDANQVEGRTASPPADVDVPATEHVVVVAGLTAGRGYKYRVIFDDGRLSADTFSFQTRPEADHVSDVTVRSVSPTQARVAWRRRGGFSPGVRVSGLDGRPKTFWPEPSGEPDAVRVPLASDELNRLEICFRELEVPPPDPATLPDRVSLPPVPGPARARRWTNAMLAALREPELKAFATELLGLPARLVSGLRKPAARPGRELVERLNTKERAQVLEEGRRSARRWLRGRYALLPDLEVKGLPGGPDVEVLLAAVAAWMADPTYPEGERDAFRERLGRLVALDAAGQLIGGEDLLGIEALGAARLSIERRVGLPPGRDGESLLEPLGVNRAFPLPIPSGVWGDEQADWMRNTMDIGGTPLEAVLKAKTQLAIPGPKSEGVSLRWFRLAPVPAAIKLAAGPRLTVVVTNLDPSQRLILRFGEHRTFSIRNTLAAHPAYVNLERGFSRAALDRCATTISLAISPGVLDDDARSVSFALDAYTAENSQGLISSPPLVWFHDVALANR